MFFVATAADGRVNISPKSLDSLRFSGPNHCVWYNYNGSGNETASHILRNPRMTLLFTSFDAQPMNIRLFGRAKSLRPNDEGWDAHYTRFDHLQGIRQIFEMEFDLVTVACGFSTPHMEIVAERAEKGLIGKFSQMGDEEIRAYQQSRGVDKNLDGLPTDISFEG